MTIILCKQSIDKYNMRTLLCIFKMHIIVAIIIIKYKKDGDSRG